jgi:hypothetical protein
MWPQQAADKIKDVAQHHDFTWTTNFQKLEWVGEWEREREREKERTKNQRTTYTYDTCCKTQDTKNQKLPQNLQQVWNLWHSSFFMTQPQNSKQKGKCQEEGTSGPISTQPTKP